MMQMDLKRNFVDLTNGLKLLLCTIVDEVKNRKEKFQISLDTKIKLDQLFKTFHHQYQHNLSEDEINYLLKVFLQCFQAQIKIIVNEESVSKK